MRIRYFIPLFLLSAHAHADELINSIYAGIFGTGSAQQSLLMTNYKPEFLTFTGDTSAPFGRIYYAPGNIPHRYGGGGGFNLGYRYNCFRFEGEFLYNVNTFRKISYPNSIPGNLVFESSKTVANNLNQTYLTGQSAEYMGFANFYFDLLPSENTDDHFYPYAGVGIGYQRVQVSSRFKAKDWRGITVNQLVVYGPSGQTPPCIDGTNSCVYNYGTSTGRTLTGSSMIGQGILGLGYEMDSYFNFYMDFRYLATPKITNFNQSFQFYTINLGLNGALFNL